MILKINDRLRNRVINFFSDVHINLKYDSCGSTFSLMYYFDPNNTEHKELSCVGHYHICTIEHNGELLLTGFILSIKFKSSNKRHLCMISGYSLAGVLQDCEIPLTVINSLQSDRLNLRQVAQKIVAPFTTKYGLNVVIDSTASSAMEQVYEETEGKITQKALSYLVQLANQKNIVVSNNEKGDLVFTKYSSDKKPIAEFDINNLNSMSGVEEMEFTFNGQGMHSEITVVGQASDDDEDQAAQANIPNPYVPIVYRPTIVKQTSGNGDDSAQAARNILAQELRNMHLGIKFSRWIINNKIIRPGNNITVLNPEVYLYKTSKWMIEEVDLVIDSGKETSEIKCVVPEVYSGQTPQYLFKGINLH